MKRLENGALKDGHTNGHDRGWGWQLPHYWILGAIVNKKFKQTESLPFYHYVLSNSKSKSVL